MIERLRSGDFSQPEPNPWKNTSRADVHKVVLHHNGHEPQQAQNGIHGEDEDEVEGESDNENDNDNDENGGEAGEVQVPGYLESLMSICVVM